MAKNKERKKSTAKKTKSKKAKYISKTSTQKKAALSVLKARRSNDPMMAANKDVHVYRSEKICRTNTRGFETPQNRSPTELVLDASEGFVPLWAEHVTLRWRFNEGSMLYFRDPTGAKDVIRELFAEAVIAWSDATPIRFRESQDVWDFEIVMRNSDDCDINGCTLASAFFPDGGRHELVIYPKMFTQDYEEWVETMVHEIGHIFGLRHFFANVHETAFPSEIFGTHQRFSIMNYGHFSQLTNKDISDLKLLYDLAWSEELTSINGTPIVLVRPYHELQLPPDVCGFV